MNFVKFDLFDFASFFGLEFLKKFLPHRGRALSVFFLSCKKTEKTNLPIKLNEAKELTFTNLLL